MTDASTPADAQPTTPIDILAETTDPSRLLDHPEVSSETATIETDQEHVDHAQSVRGMAIAGVTRDGGDVLLVKHTDPEYTHDWVLPHGAVDDDAGWAETAVDWVDGLTGIDAELDAVVHVRRNDLTLPEEDEITATTYHVVFGAHPVGDTTPADDVRYDCDDEWVAGWYDSIPDSARETESQDIALFLD